jgi:hypothetical protein
VRVCMCVCVCVCVCVVGGGVVGAMRTKTAACESLIENDESDATLGVM